jgi:DNA-binding SARP family transcriptional activator
MRVVRLQLLGSPALYCDGVEASGPATHRHRLALLALIALAPGRSLSRDRILALLWPESDTAAARNLLNTAVHVLRQVMGETALVSTRDELRLALAVEVDVLEVLTAFEQGRREEAVRACHSPFLDGFFVKGAPEFEHWADTQRSAITERYRQALGHLAQAASDQGDVEQAVRWWRRLVVDDPYNTRAVMGLMGALEAAGDHGNALELAAEHERRLRDELDASVDPLFVAMVARLRHAPNGSARPAAMPKGVRAAGPEVRAPPDAELSPGAAARDRVPAVLGRRRATWVAGATLMALMVAASLLVARPSLGWGEPELLDRRAIAAHFENRTGRDSLDPVGYMVADRITRRVLALGLTEMVASDEVLRATLALQGARPHAAANTPATALARETRARLVVTGSYYLQGDTIAIRAAVLDALDGTIRRSFEEERGELRDITSIVTAVADRVAGAMATLLDDRFAQWSDHASQPPSLEAYRHYAAGMDTFLAAQRRGARKRDLATSAANAFRAAAAADSTFTAPVIWAVYAHLNGAEGAVDDLLERLHALRPRMAPWDRAMADHVLAYMRDDRPAALEAAREAVRYAPDSEWLYKYAFIAAGLGREREALAALRRIDPQRGWMREWPSYWILLTRTLHLLGQSDAELAAARAFLRAHPDERNPLPLFRALVARGHVVNALDLAWADVEEGNIVPQQFITELRLHGFDREADSLAAFAAQQMLSSRVFAGKDWIALRIRAETFLEAGRLDDAAAVLARLSGDDSVAMTHPVPRHLFLGLAGRLAARRGAAAQVDSILSAMQQIAREHPTLAAQGLRIHQADVLAEAGRIPEAFSLVREQQAAIGRGSFGHGYVPSRVSVLLRDYQPYRQLTRPSR